MRRFTCPHCDAPVFFAAQECIGCGSQLGYRLELDDVALLGELPRCAGHGTNGCNWLVADGQTWCRSCRLDPDPAATPDSTEHRIFQAAKRRVIRQLVQYGIDAEQADPPLRFELDRSTDDRRVTIGHADGLVSLDVAEADPVTREEARLALGEPYRTPLGHVRHETGHWHWQAFVDDGGPRTERSRERFGDDTADYADALARHYDRDDDGSWHEDFISFYASAHPYEDYAESFAHVLHFLDTLETARSFGLADPEPVSFDERYLQWTEVTVALNALSRSMGTADPYPFAPSATAVDKLRVAYWFLREQPPG